MKPGGMFNRLRIVKGPFPVEKRGFHFQHDGLHLKFSYLQKNAPSLLDVWNLL